jgi:gliding motility-associated-like protein
MTPSPKTTLLLVCLFIYGEIGAQCSNSATLTGSGFCLGSMLSVAPDGGLAKIVWNNNGTDVASLGASIAFAANATTVAGGIYPGSTLDRLNFPAQIFVDCNDNVYIADEINSRVVKWAAGAGAGVVVAGGNGAGSAANQFNQAAGVTVDNNGNVYVADASNSRVQKWVPGATAGVTVAGGNGAGAAANQLNGPQGIFIDAAGVLYIADALNNRVQKWAAGATTGTTVAGGNGRGNAANQFFDPLDVFVDAGGDVFVADGDNHRVQEWTPGSTGGITVASGLGLPAGVFVDAAGDVYVVDNVLCDVLLFTPGSTSGVVVAGKGYDGDAADLLAYPGDVWFDQAGNMFVADGANYRIQEFANQSTISNTYMPTSTGIYTATVFGQEGYTVTTNSITISPIVTPAVSINAPTGIICAGSVVQFEAAAVNGGSNPSFQWTVNDNAEGGSSSLYSSSSLASGDIVGCVMTSDASCPTLPTATAAPVTVAVTQGATVTITPGSVAVCPGDPVTFTAVETNGGTNPTYEWQVDGDIVGGNTGAYNTSALLNGDTVRCILTANGLATCGTASSNPVVVVVNAAPTVQPGQVFSVLAGKSDVLNPDLSGDVSSYLWSPATGLSDTTVADPTADPTQTTMYTLTVTGIDGCTSSGQIEVKVESASKIPLLPNAFTPNGDGKNDVFYVLEVPAGSVVSDFSVFDRWGDCVFKSVASPAGDPAYGWNGEFRGSNAPTGAYVYMLVVKSAIGMVTQYKGTVMLIR